MSKKEPATIVARNGRPKSANGCFCRALRYLAASELGSVARKDFEENCIVRTNPRELVPRASLQAFVYAECLKGALDRPKLIDGLTWSWLDIEPKWSI